MARFIKSQREIMGLEDGGILGEGLVPSVLLELTAVVSRGQPAQRRHLKGPLVSF